MFNNRTMYFYWSKLGFRVFLNLEIGVEFKPHGIRILVGLQDNTLNQTFIVPAHLVPDSL